MIENILINKLKLVGELKDIQLIEDLTNRFLSKWNKIRKNNFQLREKVLVTKNDKGIVINGFLYSGKSYNWYKAIKESLVLEHSFV